MSTTKDGGPAFPMQALAALLSESGRYDSTGAALDAYCFADAMLSARERGQEGGGQ